jgi:hypothetical protein
MLEGLYMLAGMRVVPHPLAREVRDEWKVERHPTPKKRRQWRVVKHHIDRPGCYQVGDTFYMHPELMEKLRHATVPSNAELRGRPLADGPA